MSPDGKLFADDVRSLIRQIGKERKNWQRQDLVDYCMREEIRIINFRYPALDGKLKELRLPVNSRTYLERILTAGERVDGSSLFPGLFATTASDLYVLPIYSWAFVNPWAKDELEILCRFANREGDPEPLTPDNVLFDASERFERECGAELHALAELEFYVFTRPEGNRFSGLPQRNYHQSSPYLNSRSIVNEMLRVVSETVGKVKYCHSEVGYIDSIRSDVSEIDGCRVEQYELEFDLMPIAELGYRLMIARWLIRETASRHGASVTFVPKLDEGMAGNGMHLHMALMRDGQNIMQEADGALSVEAKKLVGGLLAKAVPLTAFGSTVAASYLRLVPGQEAPTNVCWGLQNRATLIRVPLSFSSAKRLDQVMNPAETGPYPESLARPTVEYRSPDGSAFGLLLLAAVTMCAASGIASSESLDLAESLQVGRDSKMEPASFEQLPTTAVASALALARERKWFEDHGMPSRLIDIVIDKLNDENDVGLSAKLRGMPASERLVASRRLMHKDLHKH